MYVWITPAAAEHWDMQATPAPAPSLLPLQNTLAGVFDGAALLSSLLRALGSQVCTWEGDVVEQVRLAVSALVVPLALLPRELVPHTLAVGPLQLLQERMAPFAGVAE